MATLHIPILLPPENADSEHVLNLLYEDGSLRKLEEGLTYDPESGRIEPLDDPGAATAHLPRKYTVHDWLNRDPDAPIISTDPDTGIRYNVHMGRRQQPTTNNHQPKK
jgi:hypothetical protein